MPSEKKTLTVFRLIGKILEPGTNIKDASSRRESRLITSTSLILATFNIIIGVIGIFVGFSTIAVVGLIVISAILVAAFALGRSENLMIGSILLVSGIILEGFLISSSIQDTSLIIIILTASIIPALVLSLTLLPILAIVGISIIALITLGGLPVMARISSGTGLALFIGLAFIEGSFILIAWFKEYSENRQKDELGDLRARLEERVEERTRYTRIAADIAQEIILSSTLQELLNQTVYLTKSRFGFSHVAIYLANEAQRQIELKAAEGLDASRLLQTGKHIAYGPPSLLGWVAENKQTHLVTRLAEDPLQLEAEFLTETISDLGIPIVIRDRLLGVMDVQSTKSSVFNNETIIVLQMLATEIGTALRNASLLEAGQGSLQESINSYQAGYKIAGAITEDDIYSILQELLSRTPYTTLFLVSNAQGFQVKAGSNPHLPDGKHVPALFPLSIVDLEQVLAPGIFIGEIGQLDSLPFELLSTLREMQIIKAALIPLKRAEKVTGVLILGMQEDIPLDQSNLLPYLNLMNLIGGALDRIQEKRRIEFRISDMETISRLNSKIAKSKNEKEILEAVHRSFSGKSKAAILLIADNKNFRISTSVDLLAEEMHISLPENINIVPEDIYMDLGRKILVEKVSTLAGRQHAQYLPDLANFAREEINSLPFLNNEIIKLFEIAQFDIVGLLPVIKNEELIGLIIIGSRNYQPLSFPIGTFDVVNEMVVSAFDQIRNQEEIKHRLNEDEAIILMNQEISSIRELPTLYSTLHTHIRQTLGDVNFFIALFHEKTNSISIPYLFEKGSDNNDTLNTIEPFPIGEGLTSILIRTKQPLMLVEDTEKRALSLGAKIAGKPAKSWLGTPMVVTDEVIGAIVVQDVEHEFAFDDNDLRFLSFLSTQVAGAIYNKRLLDETRNRAIQLQTAAEIARDISGSLDLGELLNKAVTLIRERFNFYHAAVFLIDSMNEFAIIREATGEAGTQMKRAGHKLKVGSKSIVGFVTGSGETLIVNDTSRDATYFANPLLPETRAELAIPLKVGQRILGVLDVQSIQPYSFGEEDISVLRILSDQMAVAVINSELFADTQEHLSQHRLLHHVTTAAASGTTLEEALNSAVQGLQVTLGGDRVSILLADKIKKTLNIKSYAGYSEEVGQLKIPFGEGITGWVAVHMQPQRINDVFQDSRYIQVGSNVRSELAVPLSYRGDLLGVLNVESDQAGAYNENDEEMLGTLGGSLAAIISNARLIEQVRRQVEHERMLYDVTSKIRRSTTMETIIKSTANELSKALGANRTQIKINPLGNDQMLGDREQSEKPEGN